MLDLERKKERQRKYQAKFLAEHGLSTGCFAYRIKMGIPLDKPVAGGRPERVGPKRAYVRREVEARPVKCVIVRGEGRGPKCLQCQGYGLCLDYAVLQGWQGWRVK